MTFGRLRALPTNSEARPGVSYPRPTPACRTRSVGLRLSTGQEPLTTGANTCSNRVMVDASDPNRALIAQLIRTAWRTAVDDEAAALDALEKACESAPGLRAGAGTDAAEFWVHRGDDGMVDAARSRLAAERLRRLAVGPDDVPPLDPLTRPEDAKRWKAI